MARTSPSAPAICTPAPSDDQAALACWGFDGAGQSTPPSGEFTALSAGPGYACAIRADATLECWGAGGPSAEPGGTYTAAGVGSGFACAVATDATLTCWGETESGDPMTPPAGTYSSVSAGRNRAYAIATDGTATGWGNDTLGVGMAPTLRMAATTAIPLHWWSMPLELTPVTYDVRYRRAAWNGSFSPRATWRAGTSATSATFLGAAGYKYCFSVRAHSGGATSAWSAPERCQITPVDDRAMVRAGSWAAGTGPGYYQGTNLRSSAYGARLSIGRSDASSAQLLVTTCPTCGTVKVYRGSNVVQTVSLYSATTVNRVFIDLPRFFRYTGPVMIQVVSTGKRVIIDGLAVNR